MKLRHGNFVRVRRDNEFRPGADGMVVEDLGTEVGLIFGYDRYCQRQNVVCVGTEMWQKSELDLSTVET